MLSLVYAIAHDDNSDVIQLLLDQNKHSVIRGEAMAENPAAIHVCESVVSCIRGLGCEGCDSLTQRLLERGTRRRKSVTHIA